MAGGDKDVEMQHSGSSPTSMLSSPPSALSGRGSPSRFINAGRANIEMDEIIVDPSVAPRFRVMQPPPNQTPAAPEGVRLTQAGLPRKKPGRKPGSTVKPKVPTDGTAAGSGTEAPKQRRPRKPRDPNAPPIQRKRKSAATEATVNGDPMDVDEKPRSTPPLPSRQPKITELASMRPGASTPAPMSAPAQTQSAVPQATRASEPPAPVSFVQPKAHPGSMQSILNQDPPPPPKPQPVTAPVAPAPSRPVFDPVRGNYDPVRETMITRDPYGTGPLGSPRAPAPTPTTNRASASPSIASLVDPAPHGIVSPVPHQSSYGQTAAHSSRLQETKSLPPSPSQHSVAPRKSAQPLAVPTIVEAKRPAPGPTPKPAPLSVSAKSSAEVSAPAVAPVKQESKIASVKTGAFTSMSAVPSDTPAAAAIAAASPAGATMSKSAQSKKVAAVVQQERDNLKHGSSNSSSPKIGSLKDALPVLGERSILDFGKVAPGDETKGSSIVLHIPLVAGETNKYVNFMRMAEERYGWDALHPRLAANRDRKARIAAASAALEKNGSGRESGADDDVSEADDSDAEVSNVEMGGMGNGPGVASGADGALSKPPKKKRRREDEYDKDDDFVDDSELLWEEQAAASRDGFFVYSGPLIPEVETPAVPDGPPKRGRGSRGGRGGARGAARGEGTGRGRGGGPGSRGGTTTRKPRITKLEKEQRDREKAEREKLAQMTSKSVGSTSANNIPLSVAETSANGASG